jgi:hypothetical protein
VDDSWFVQKAAALSQWAATPTFAGSSGWATAGNGAASAVKATVALVPVALFTVAGHLEHIVRHGPFPQPESNESNEDARPPGPDAGPAAPDADADPPPAAEPPPEAAPPSASTEEDEEEADEDAFE